MNYLEQQKPDYEGPRDYAILRATITCADYWDNFSTATWTLLEQCDEEGNTLHTVMRRVGDFANARTPCAVLRELKNVYNLVSLEKIARPIVRSEIIIDDLSAYLTLIGSASPSTKDMNTQLSNCKKMLRASADEVLIRLEQTRKKDFTEQWRESVRAGKEYHPTNEGLGLESKAWINKAKRWSTKRVESDNG